MTTPQVSAGSLEGGHATGAAPDAIGLAWLVTGRWFTVVAAAGAVIAGRSALEAQLPIEFVAAIIAVILASNLWLWWRLRNGDLTSGSMAGALLCLDVVLLSWLLLNSGGVLNPASVFYLVQIVLAALVLGRTWAWIVTALSVAGYATLFLAPTDHLRDAQAMHPGIALHMRGMWIAFAATALIIAVMVTRLVTSVERRDRALDMMRDRNARALRVASLTTVVAGAAHELGTPLATIAVAARELERAIAERGSEPAWGEDARLIRAEIDRCRAILDQMGGRVTEPLGEAPRSTSCGAVVQAALQRFGESDRARIDIDIDTVAGIDAAPVVWPVGAVSQALANLISNALYAAGEAGRVRITVAAVAERVSIDVHDSGPGMRREDLARAGEPFFTTKGPGAGMGLGIFVARSTVEQLGGALRLAPGADGGLTASITLPQDVVRAKAGRHE